MQLEKFKAELTKIGIKFQENMILAPFTTFKIGGPADIFLDVKTDKELADVLKSAHDNLIPVTILGWGSNILIADTGLRGVVIRIKSGTIKIFTKDGRQEQVAAQTEEAARTEIQPRLIQAEPETYYDFADLDYNESGKPQIKVSIDSGVILQYAINYLIARGITGLQWFSGIPGSIGGAIYNNIHGGAHFLFEFLDTVETLSPEGKFASYAAKDIQSGYDFSGFQKNKDIILRGTFNLFLGDQERALKTSMEWARRKKLQPRNSAGCMFQNITAEQAEKLHFKSNGYGYIIDKILNLKGTVVGGAKISEKHAAFIENTGKATAQDVIALIRKVNKASMEKIALKPKLEIFLLGFDPKDIQDLV